MAENLTRQYYELCRMLGIRPPSEENSPPPKPKKVTQESIDAVHFLKTGEGADRVIELSPLDTQLAKDGS